MTRNSIVEARLGTSENLRVPLNAFSTLGAWKFSFNFFSYFLEFPQYNTDVPIVAMLRVAIVWRTQLSENVRLFQGIETYPNMLEIGGFFKAFSK